MSEFDIEEYINSLPDDIETINVLGKELTYLPDLSRFKNLKILYCQLNKLVSLPLLPNSLEALYCYDNKLVSLPPLPNSLKLLGCRDNNLTSLPSLPDSLEALICGSNQLVSLPSLPNSLKQLRCFDNKLVYLPPLPNSLEILFCKNNPTDEFIHPYNLDVLKKETITLSKFRDLYYCIKYKFKFIKWLWKSREKKIQEEYHPDRLKEILEGKDINDIDF